jgi:hypothetical protein
MFQKIVLFKITAVGTSNLTCVPNLFINISIYGVSQNIHVSMTEETKQNKPSGFIQNSPVIRSIYGVSWYLPMTHRKKSVRFNLISPTASSMSRGSQDIPTTQKNKQRNVLDST